MKTVAIVIPCRNEERYIARCLDSILRQDYDPSLVSVYVCDGKSTDGTIAIIHEYTSVYPGIFLLSNEKQSTPFALNLGIRQSLADIVIILGAHSELYPDYVSKCVAAFGNGENIGCTGGIIENVYENAVAEAIGKAMSSGFGVGNAHFRTGARDGFVDTVAFGAYRREVFERAGYFDEELIRNQDDEFNFRVLKSGFRIWLARSIRSKYYVRGSFGKLFRQYYQYGYWKVYVNKKHRTVTTLRQLVPLFFVLYLFAGPAAALIYPLLLWPYLAGIVAYVALSAYSAARLAAGFRQALQIMRAFFILHFSYGWGYLKGIADFFIFQKQIRTEETLTR